MKRINVGDFKLGKQEESCLMEVIRGGRLSESLKTAEFQRQWARYIGTKFAVAVNSGTSALIAAITALKIKYSIPDGARVVTSPLTFIATVNAIVHCRLKPFFVDVDRNTLVITAENIARALKKAKNIRLILPVHLMGYPADMPAINRLAEKYDLPVMEDAAQAHGTLCQGRRVGSQSQISIFSFYIAHNIQAGEMGAVNTSDESLFKLVKKIKAHGRMCECPVCRRSSGACPVLREHKGRDDLDPRFNHDLIGYNFKIMEFQAALALSQLKKAGEIFHKRNQNVKYLNRGLQGLSGILQLPVYSKDISYLAYPLIINDRRMISRMELCKALESEGIETRPLFGCIPLQQPAYAFMRPDYRGKLPNAEYIGSQGFYIGCHQYLKKEDLDYIIETFHKILE